MPGYIFLKPFLHPNRSARTCLVHRSAWSRDLRLRASGASLEKGPSKLADLLRDLHPNRLSCQAIFLPSHFCTQTAPCARLEARSKPAWPKDRPTEPARFFTKTLMVLSIFSLRAPGRSIAALRVPGSKPGASQLGQKIGRQNQRGFLLKNQWF